MFINIGSGTNGCEVAPEEVGKASLCFESGGSLSRGVSGQYCYSR
jgi:hypothetical protein